MTRTWFRTAACVFAALTACLVVASSAAPGAAGAASGNAGARSVKGLRSSGPSPLIDHGGKVLAASKIYAIWWGPPSTFPPDARTGIEQLLGGFNDSSYLAIADQYMRAAPLTTGFQGSLVDTTVPPSHAPKVSTIVAEVGNELSAYGLTPDPTAIYLVYTSNFPNANYCAWHAAGTIAGVQVQVGYLPNTAGVAGCDPGHLYSTQYSEGTRSVADSTAHEFMESITDPVPLTGWADKSGQEMADKCNFTYSAPVTLSNGSTWQLQREWSNEAGGCVQTSP
jgi:hypothetical protein